MTLRIARSTIALVALAGIGCSKGSAECAQAYDSLAQMVQSMQKSLPGAANAKGSLPPKDQFVKACSELPKDVQQCMNMSYAMGHLQECQEAQKRVDPAKMQQVKAMMGRKG